MEAFPKALEVTQQAETAGIDAVALEESARQGLSSGPLRGRKKSGWTYWPDFSRTWPGGTPKWRMSSANGPPFLQTLRPLTRA